MEVSKLIGANKLLHGKTLVCNESRIDIHSVCVFEVAVGSTN
jgi:hypothetical protein